MRIESKGGASSRFVAACFVGGAAFLGQATDEAGTVVASIFVAIVILLFLDATGVGGSAASSVAIEGRDVIATFALRRDEDIPIASIAAVEIRRSFLRSKTLEPIVLIRIFQRDEPAIIELRAAESDANAFLDALARHAIALGVSNVAPFEIPRRHYVHDLLPLLAAAPILLLFPWRISWGSFGLALATFVLHAMLTWSGMRRLARTPEALAEWTRLLANVRAS